MMERRNPMLTVAAFLGVLVIMSCADNLDDVDVDDINDLVDETLMALKEEDSIVSGLKTISFPNISQKDFKTSNGKVTGMSNLHRHGDCHLTFRGNSTITVSGHLGAKNIRFSMNYRVRPLFLWVDGLMKGGVNLIALEVSLYSDGKSFRLKSLRISHLDGFSINHVSVLGMPSSKLLEDLANSFATTYKRQITRAIEDGIASFLRKVISCQWDGKC